MMSASQPKAEPRSRVIQRGVRCVLRDELEVKFSINLEFPIYRTRGLRWSRYAGTYS